MNSDNQIDAVERTLIGALVSNYPAGFSDANTKFPNASGTTPDGSAWLRVGIASNFGPISSDASGCYEINQGLFVVGVFVAKGTGSQSAWKTAQHIKHLYSAERFDDICIESAVITPTSEPENSPWFGINVNVTFTFEGYLT